MYSAEFLTQLRQLMKRHGLWAVIVPTSDPHNSEYVASQFQLRAALTNFSGSAGTAVVTQDKALMWTDGRYYLEAAAAMPAPWQLQREGIDQPMVDWLEAEAASAASPLVGMDAYVSTVAAWEAMCKKLQLQHTDITNQAFRATCPVSPDTMPVYARPAQFCGEDTSSKAARLADKLLSARCDAVLLSALDDIAWLTNMRGADVPFNPVFISYAYMTAEDRIVHVFVDLAKVSAELRGSVGGGIEFHPYSGLAAFLAERAKGITVAIDEQQTSMGVLKLLNESGAKPRRTAGFVKVFKGIKNEVELEGMRNCHKRDGCALVRYMAWLTKAVAEKQVLNEITAADRLEALRREEQHFVQLSFPSISGSGPNGAVIHYRPCAETTRPVAAGELYLIDSGAQYYDGTTDVTRVLCFSAPTAEQKEAYTAVLKGHIALGDLAFPGGVSGHRLDSFARMNLWALGLDYAHGTGHGVGSFLNVHEGPHSIHLRLPPAAVPLEVGMIVSNEPGYYKDGSYGIRIENLVEVVPRPTKYNERSLGFRNLTMAPYERDLIDSGALTPSERAYVDQYHAEVRSALLPLLEKHGDKEAIAYLEEKTRPLSP